MARRCIPRSRRIFWQRNKAQGRLRDTGTDCSRRISFGKEIFCEICQKALIFSVCCAIMPAYTVCDWDDYANMCIK